MDDERREKEEQQIGGGGGWVFISREGGWQTGNFCCFLLFRLWTRLWLRVFARAGNLGKAAVSVLACEFSMASPRAAAKMSQSAMYLSTSIVRQLVELAVCDIHSVCAHPSPQINVACGCKRRAHVVDIWDWCISGSALSDCDVHYCVCNSRTALGVCVFGADLPHKIQPTRNDSCSATFPRLCKATKNAPAIFHPQQKKTFQRLQTMAFNQYGTCQSAQ